MRFQNREDAARRLAEKLARYKGQHALVLGVPRGAVPMARRIAEALDADLDVVLVHKLRAPEQPELAIGAIDERGDTLFNEAFGVMAPSSSYLDREKQTQLDEIRRRRRLYTPVRAPIDPAGRIVILVDDGIATGASMLAAIRYVRTRAPRKLVMATAVAPPQTLQRLAREVDEVVCLHAPDDFYAVGQFFDDFGQVSDEEVVACLDASAAGTSGRAGGPAR